MPDCESKAISFHVSKDGRLYLTGVDIKEQNLEDFVNRFKDCFDFNEEAMYGNYIGYFYPEGIPAIKRESNNV